jgi:hypothetical protein
MLGKMVPFGDVPYYWTRHYNKSVAYAGYAQDYDEVFIQGEPLKNNFVAFFIKGNKV